MIHRDMNENETETNRYTLDKLLEEFPDVTSTAMIEDSVKQELDNSNQHNLQKETKQVKMMKREKNQQNEIPNSEKVYEIISRGNGIISNVNFEEINEGDERCENMGAEDDNSVEESKIRSSAHNVNNNDDNLVSGFYEYTCSGDSVCDIFDNEDDIITEDSILRVKTNRAIWLGILIEIPFSDLPQYSNGLKLIWIDTKNEERVLIKN